MLLGPEASGRRRQGCGPGGSPQLGGSSAGSSWHGGRLVRAFATCVPDASPQQLARGKGTLCVGIGAQARESSRQGSGTLCTRARASGARARYFQTPRSMGRIFQSLQSGGSIRCVRPVGRFTPAGLDVLSVGGGPHRCLASMRTGDRAPGSRRPVHPSHRDTGRVPPPTVRPRYSSSVSRETSSKRLPSRETAIQHLRFA